MPKTPPVEEGITRREFLTGKQKKGEATPEKKEGEKTSVETEPVADEKKITRREFLTGKWFK